MVVIVALLVLAGILLLSWCGQRLFDPRRDRRRRPVSWFDDDHDD